MNTKKWKKIIILVSSLVNEVQNDLMVILTIVLTGVFGLAASVVSKHSVLQHNALIKFRIFFVECSICWPTARSF